MNSESSGKQEKYVCILQNYVIFMIKGDFEEIPVLRQVPQSNLGLLCSIRNTMLL